MQEQRSLFDYLNNIYSKRLGMPEDNQVKGFIWPINRMLSMEKALLETIAYLTKYIFTLGPRYYKLLYRVVPTSLASRNKYLKVDKEVEDELLNRYVQYFRLSKREVKDYLKILFKQYSKEEVFSFVGLEVK